MRFQRTRRAWIRAPDGAPPAPARRRGAGAEVAEGLRLVWRDPILRALAAASATNNFFANVLDAAYVLYATRELGVTPVVLGGLGALGSVGGLVGALASGWLTARLGLGPTMIGAALLLAGSNLLVPLAGAAGASPPVAGAAAAPVLLLGAARLLAGLSVPPYTVNFSALRQTATPDHLQGRVNASVRVVTAGMMPLDALVGGALGEALGLRPPLLLGAFGTLLAVLWLLGSPVRGLPSGRRLVPHGRTSPAGRAVASAHSPPTPWSTATPPSTWCRLPSATPPWPRRARRSTPGPPVARRAPWACRPRAGPAAEGRTTNG